MEDIENINPFLDSSDEQRVNGEDSKQDITIKDYFGKYLLEDRYSEKGALSLIGILSRYVDNYIRMVAYPHHTTVFELLDISRLAEYRDMLKRDPDFISFNAQKGRRPINALQKYIDFVKIFIESDSAKTHSDVPVDPVSKIKTGLSEVQRKSSMIDNEDERAVMKIIRELQELENAEMVLKRNGLSVNPEITGKIKSLNDRKSLIVKEKIIERPTLGALEKYGLLNIVTFKYVHLSRSFEILDPAFNAGIEEEVSDMEGIISLMNKNAIPVPAEVSNRLRASKSQKMILEKAKEFGNWLKTYTSDLYLGDLLLESIYYSPRTRLMIKLTQMDMSNST